VADGAGTANRRFAVAAVDWKSVGGAWTSESPGLPTEQIQIAGIADRIENGIVGDDSSGSAPRIVESDTTITLVASRSLKT